MVNEVLGDDPIKKADPNQPDKNTFGKLNMMTANTAYNLSKGVPGRGWRQIDKIDEDNKDQENTSGGIIKALGPKRLQNGIYRPEPDPGSGWFSNQKAAVVYKDGSVYPAPLKVGDRHYPEAYDKCMKLLKDQGYTTVTINFTNTELNAGYLRDNLKTLMKLADQNQLAFQLGDSTKKFILDELGREALEKYEKFAEDSLKQKTSLDLMAQTTSNDTLNYYAKQVSKNDKWEPPSTAVTDADKATWLRDHFNETVYGDDHADMSDAQKATALGKEWEAVDKKLEELEMARKEVTATVDTYDKILKEPKSIQERPRMEGIEFSSRWSRLLSLRWLSTLNWTPGNGLEEERKLSDPETLVNRIENANTKNTGSRDELLRSIEKKEADLLRYKDALKNEMVELDRKATPVAGTQPTDAQKALKKQLDPMQKKSTEVEDRLTAGKTETEKLRVVHDKMPEKIREARQKAQRENIVSPKN